MHGVARGDVVCAGSLLIADAMRCLAWGWAGTHRADRHTAVSCVSLGMSQTGEHLPTRCLSVPHGPPLGPPPCTILHVCDLPWSEPKPCHTCNYTSLQFRRLSWRNFS